MKPRISINYRRSDSSAIAGRINDGLKARFGRSRVFMDTEDVHAGEDFVEATLKQLGNCTILLVVIGPEWLQAKDKNGQCRLQNPDDLVRREVLLGLTQSSQTRVVPVLVSGAVNLTTAGLPEEISALASRNSVSIRHEQFDQDLAELARSIGYRWWMHPLIIPGGVALLVAGAIVIFLSIEEIRGRFFLQDKVLGIIKEDISDESMEKLFPEEKETIDTRIPFPAGEFLDKAFIGFPSARLYEEPAQKAVIDELLWGDLVVRRSQEIDGWVKVWARYQEGWVRVEDLQADRLLEAYFLDIGSESGTLLVTPNEKIVLVDAGQNEWMRHLLHWRFGPSPIRVHASVITHPDFDRYRGFEYLARDEGVQLLNVYHNGLFRTSTDRLGRRVQVGRERLLIDLIEDREELMKVLSDTQRVGRSRYASILSELATSERVSDIRSLSREDIWVPGFDGDEQVSLQVLGPVIEHTSDNVPGLRQFGSDSATKNGHSIVLKVRFRSCLQEILISVLRIFYLSSSGIVQQTRSSPILRDCAYVQMATLASSF